MSVKHAELAAAVLTLAKRPAGGKRTAKSVAAYLVEQRRTKELHSLARALEELRYKQDGVLEVTATATRPLSAKAKQDIKQLFPRAKQVRVNEEIDQELRGGVTIRALDQVADLSVEARLRKLRQGVK